jgi:glycosyltransferase involved in cell wall biosynthesis
MKIVYLSDIDISVENGPGINEREFVQTLQVESELRDDQAFFIIPYPSKKLDFRLRNVKYYQLKLNKKPSFLWFNILSVSWVLSKLILKKLARFDIDLFILRLSVNSILIPLFLYLWGQRYSIKTLEDIYNFRPIPFNLKWTIFVSGLRRVLGIGLKKALFIDVCTPQLYYNYKNKYNLKNIKVIENGVNIDLFNILDKDYCKNKCGLKTFRRVVGYCGGYPSSRGARQLVDISADLISKYPDCGILIIGDDSELSLLRQKAKQHGTNSRIVFKGIIAYEDTNLYMNCMDVGVGLDRDEKIKFVGNASQKIRQYLGCGVPVMFPKGTNKKIVDEGLGIEVSPSDLDQIYKGVCFWLDKSAKDRKELRIKAYEFARDNFSTKVIFEERYAAWENAIRKGIFG